MVTKEIHKKIMLKTEKEKALTLNYIHSLLDNIVHDPFSDPREARLAKEILYRIANYKPFSR